MALTPEELAELKYRADHYARGEKAARKIRRRDIGLGITSGLGKLLDVENIPERIDPATYTPPQLSDQDRFDRRLELEGRMGNIIDAMQVLHDERISDEEKEKKLNQTSVENAFKLYKLVMTQYVKTGDIATGFNKKALDIENTKIKEGSKLYQTYAPVNFDAPWRETVEGNRVPGFLTEKEATAFIDANAIIGGGDDDGRPKDLFNTEDLGDLQENLAALPPEALTALTRKHEGTEFDNLMASLAKGETPEKYRTTTGLNPGQVELLRQTVQGKTEQAKQNRAMRQEGHAMMESGMHNTLSGGAGLFPPDMEADMRELYKIVASNGEYDPSFDFIVDMERDLAGGGEEFAEGLRVMSEVQEDREALVTGEGERLTRLDLLGGSHDRIATLLEELEKPNPPANLAALKNQIMGMSDPNQAAMFASYMEEQGLGDPDQAFQHLVGTSARKLRAARQSDQATIAAKEKADAASGITSGETKPTLGQNIMDDLFGKEEEEEDETEGGTETTPKPPKQRPGVVMTDGANPFAGLKKLKTKALEAAQLQASMRGK